MFLIYSSQEVIINFLVYYGVIKDVFNSDIAKEGDYKLLASRLQNFLICVEMFIAGNCAITFNCIWSLITKQDFLFLALAHQYSFPYSPFQINDQTMDRNWWGKFLAMLDMEDVRQDLSEHFGVVGDRIVGSFRGQHSYMQYNETTGLIPPAQPPAQVVSVSRVKDKNYGTYSSDRTNDGKHASRAKIGKDNQNYRIAKIEEDERSKDSPQSSVDMGSSSRNTTASMNQSSTSTSSFGINVRGIENDSINYRNPDV